ncbi:MAG: SPASM domain-containing protein [Magnetovibrio sp.]|nr:SPASM domain-containing protein [Magnetovibrio sp.]
MEDADMAALFESYISQKPVVFQVETTNHCNMKCVMCPRTDKMTRKLGHMPMDLYKKVIEEIEPFSPIDRLKWQRFLNLDLFPSSILSGEEEDFFHYVVSASALTLHGFGEPPMDLELIERIRLASEKNIPTYFSCNPMNMKDQFFQDVLDAGVSYVKYSFDGLDEDTLYKYRGRKMVVDEIYERFEKSIEAIERGGYETVLVLTMLEFGANKEQQREFLERWQSRNVYVYIKNSHHRWLYEEDDTPENTSTHTHCFCEYPFNSTSLQYDGTVIPCPLDYDGVMRMGHVSENSLEEIWHSDTYKNFRKMHAEGTLPKEHFCRSQCDMTILGDLMKKQKKA